jgi:hypothetical protein
MNAVKCGTDMNNDPIFVGRISHKGDILPAQVIPNKKMAFAAYGGEEIKSSSFEVSMCEI